MTENISEEALPPQEITENDKLIAALAYLIIFIVPILILISEELKGRAFLRYHAVQSLAVALLETVFVGLVCLLSSFLCCTLVLLVLPVAASAYCAYLAYMGKYFEIPVLTEFLADQGWLKRPAQ